MFQNIKVDIIYYNTTTDFELEFNLCGCCRMRLLTDKAADQKNFVHMLARGVSRSRVILIIGSLFGEDGILKLVSRSIGKKLTEIDNKAYGISEGENIKVINGATPLVTGDGYFGGCIIESGPQTMILLSDNKNVRKAIMHSLIHPYIEELSALALKEKANSVQHEIPTVPDEEQQSDENTVETTSTEEAPAEVEETTPDDVTESVPDIEDASVEISGGMIFTTDNDIPAKPPKDDTMANQLFIEPNRVKYTKKSYYADGEYPTDTSNYIFDDANYKRKVNTPKHSSLNIAILVLTIVLLLTAAVLCYCVFYVPAKEGLSSVKYLSDTFNTFFG